MRAVIAIFAVGLLAPPALANAWSAEGNFLLGHPVAYLWLDACGMEGRTSGVDSSCIALPEWVGGLSYSASIQPRAGLAGGFVCFYDDVQWISCWDTAESAKIPMAATRASFNSFVGGLVDWSIRV